MGLEIALLLVLYIPGVIELNVSGSMHHHVLHMQVVMVHGNLIFLATGLAVWHEIYCFMGHQNIEFYNWIS